MERHLYCFGLGYSGLALAQTLTSESWTVSGTTQSADKQATLAAEGVSADLFERTRPLDDARVALSGTTHLLVSVPPDAQGDPVIDAHGSEIASIPTLSWVGYLSTVGVYGDRDGAWVDETSDCCPANERGARRVAAERQWLEFGRHANVPVHVFRLAGIYGPRRNSIDSARAGSAKRIFKPGQVFSRIHVDDIVQVLRASMAQPEAGAIYNVCDDEPAPPQDVVAFACELAGLPAPPLVQYEEADLSAMARSFYAECKRVRNDRIKTRLGVTLRYPDYRAGLRAIAAGQSGSV